MAVIAPTVTAYEPHEYREQMERLEPFASRIHIDLMDGVFAPTKSPSVEQCWWPEGVEADIHLMYQRPMEEINQLIKLKPSLVVIHAEADVDHAEFAAKLNQYGIKAGLALLSETSVDSVKEILSNYDHALIFSGKLGFHGGQADLGLLDKVKQIHQKFPQLEVSWDGGINDQNAKLLADAGVDVLNTGGYISQSSNAQASFQGLATLIAAH